MNQKAVQEAMNVLTHGVYVIGVHTPQKDNLMTAAWLCQVSSSPAMIAVAVSKGHLTSDLMEQAKVFSVSVLNDQQKSVALACGKVSGRTEDKLKLVETCTGDDQIPLIAHAAAWMKCRVVQTVLASDHKVFFAQVEQGGGESEDVLIYHKKNFF